MTIAVDLGRKATNKQTNKKRATENDQPTSSDISNSDPESELFITQSSTPAIDSH